LQTVATRDIPIFIGPVFVHGNSDFETYAHFFGTLATKLHARDYKQLRLGSDKESSIRKAFLMHFQLELVNAVVTICCNIS